MHWQVIKLWATKAYSVIKFWYSSLKQRVTNVSLIKINIKNGNNLPSLQNIFYSNQRVCVLKVLQSDKGYQNKAVSSMKSTESWSSKPHIEVFTKKLLIQRRNVLHPSILRTTPTVELWHAKMYCGHFRRCYCKDKLAHFQEF